MTQRINETRGHSYRIFLHAHRFYKHKTILFFLSSRCIIGKCAIRDRLKFSCSAVFGVRESDHVQVMIIEAVWSRLTRPTRKIRSLAVGTGATCTECRPSTVFDSGDPNRSLALGRRYVRSSRNRRWIGRRLRNAGGSYRSIGAFWNRKDWTKLVRVSSWRAVAGKVASPDFTVPRNPLGIAGFRWSSLDLRTGLGWGLCVRARLGRGAHGRRGTIRGPVPETSWLSPFATVD